MSISLNKITLYRVLFVVLLLGPYFFNSVEVNFLVILISLLLTLATCSYKFSISFLNTLFPLFIILLITFLSSFFQSFEAIDFVKDLTYIFKPIALLVLGYVLTKKIDDKNFFFKSIVYLGVLTALFHLGNILFNLGLIMEIGDINFMRVEFGRDNFLELIAILFISINNRFLGINLKYKKTIVFVLGLSFVLYFSRTMFILILLLSLSFFGYMRLTIKGIKYFGVFLLFIVTLFAYLFSVEIKRNDETALGKFMYKLKNAPAEIFQTEIDVNNHANLWDHWRGYEALKATESLNKNGMIFWVFGRGLGSKVDLGFEAPLGDNGEGMRYISLLHNAYVYIIYKSGIIGLLVFMLFLFVLYYRPIVPNHFELNQINNIILGFSLFYLFSTLVISGVYNPKDNLTFILGGIIFLRDRQIKLDIENVKQ